VGDLDGGELDGPTPSVGIAEADSVEAMDSSAKKNNKKKWGPNLLASQSINLQRKSQPRRNKILSK